MEEIVIRALRKDPAQRWQSMQQVHDLLLGMRQKYESGVLPGTRAEAGRKRPALFAGLAVLVIAAVAGAAWWGGIARRAGLEFGPLARKPRFRSPRPRPRLRRLCRLQGRREKWRRRRPLERNTC